MNALTSFLRHYGYLHEAAPDVKGADFDALSESDQPITEAVKLAQEFQHEILDEICWELHGRLCIADGKVGPATNYLLNMPRCYHPDYEPDPLAESYKLWQREEANIPTSCRTEIGVGRVFQSLPGLDKAGTDAVYWAFCHHWTETFQDVRMTPHNDAVGNPANTIFYHRLERMSGGTLAYHYLARNRCERLDGAWNSNVNWSAVSLAVPVGGHEVGHGLGLRHVNHAQALMYPSITNASRSRMGFPHPADIAAMVQLGYKPYDNWQERRLPDSRLFLPRDATPPTPEEPPTPELLERLKRVEERTFSNLITGAANEASLQWLASQHEVFAAKLKELEGRL